MATRLAGTNRGTPDVEPFSCCHAFADSRINFAVILWATEFVDQYLIEHEFVKRLHASPQRRGHRHSVCDSDDDAQKGRSRTEQTAERTAGAA